MFSRTSRSAMTAASRTAQISQHFSAQTISKQHIRMSHQETLQKLNTGASIPALGFGTWQDKDAQANAVETALKVGYRHIDTAHIYGTEPGVAQGIKASGVPRKDIFITTKLWNNAHHPEDVEKQLDKSLKLLETDYVDLYLMHWPSPFKRGDALFPKGDDGKVVPGEEDYVDTWKGMEKVFKSGKARAIGVSNFSQAEMERLLKESSVVPAAHQIELHPYLQQKDFSAWHDKHGIHITQYSPFGNSNEIYDKGKEIGKLIEDPKLVEIGKKYNKSGAQVALAWGIAHGHSVIPKSKTESRIKANLEGDFKLSAEDVTQIDNALDRKLRFNDPSENFKWKFFTDLDGKH